MKIPTYNRNSTVAFARLIVDNKDYGVHSFVVQLRDIKTHQPLPGITLGDCGSKLVNRAISFLLTRQGLNGIDNGFIQFHNVRIPRKV